jgi:hypothetical protein
MKITVYRLDPDGVLSEHAIGGPLSEVVLRRPDGPAADRFEARTLEGRWLLAEAILGHYHSGWPKPRAIAALADHLASQSEENEIVVPSSILAEFVPLAA